jgi:3-oxoacyl-[acyl-carrier protein] reductase
VTGFDLSGRVAVVTGGAAGIGLAICRRLAAAGAVTCSWDISGGDIPCDVSDAASVERATASTLNRHGRIDILVNNAGILGPVAPTWEHDPDTFRRVLAINLGGSFLCSRAVVPIMLRRPPAPDRGRIVNLSSIQGKEGMPQAAAYAASKAALLALTKSLGKELAGEGILVNAVTPAAAETGMAVELTPQRRTEILGRIPMGRLVRVEEIAEMVAWLASPLCSFSTGAVFDLSGGRATY